MPDLKARSGMNQLLSDGLDLEEHGLVPVGGRLDAQSHTYRQLAVLAVISNRLKEITERLMEVEKLLKERGQ